MALKCIFICMSLIGMSNAGLLPSRLFKSATITSNRYSEIDNVNVNIRYPVSPSETSYWGFKYTVANDKKVPDSVYAKKEFETPLDGVAEIEAKWNVPKKNIGFGLKWASQQLGIGFSAAGDSDNTLTDVGLTASRDFERGSVTVGGQYSILKSKCLSTYSATLDDTTATVIYDSRIKDPVLSLSQRLNDVDTVTPTLSLKTGRMMYKWRRLLSSGSVESSYYPGDKVEMAWRDCSDSGTWITRAMLPLDNPKKCRLSFSKNINW